MPKKVIFPFFLFLITAVVVGFAQEKIPYVDIPTATSQVEKLKQENEQLQQEINRYLEENKTIEDNIEEWQKSLNTIEFILDRVKKKSAELFAIYNDIVDEQTRQKANETIQRNKDLKAKLEARQKELIAQIEKAEKQRQENVKKIEINQNKIQRNTDTVNLLNAAIEKTRNQTQVLSSYIDSVNEMLNEAEAVLKENLGAEK
ncbi:MAG: hypothetical protein DRP87_05870 [Spirochaetes bacterium]|nr:MAG: hypothetical protein DRP87_05870 [Spirochaetota bacterium]